MMEVRYYRKSVPQTPIYLQSGHKLRFDTSDGVTGYTLTQDPILIAQLEGFISRHIGGLGRATREEYEAFVKTKKVNGPDPHTLWREEWSPGQYARDPGAARPAVAGKPAARGDQVQPSQPAPEAPAAPFKPKTRGKKAK
jgi:hypothetical protein